MNDWRKSSNPFGLFVWNAFVWKSFTGMVWVFEVSPKPMSSKPVLLTILFAGFCYTLLATEEVDGLEKESKSKSPKALFFELYLEG